MNKVRRKKVSDIIGMLRVVYDNIDEIKSEEENAFDSLPEGIQSSLRGEQMEEVVEMLDEVIDHIDEVIDLLEDVVQ